MRISSSLVALALALGACPGGGDDTVAATDLTGVATSGGTTGTSSSTGDATGSDAATSPTTSIGGSSGGEGTTGDPNACIDSLPPEGGPCMDGEQCSPFGNSCRPFPYAFCMGSVWQHQQVFGGGEPDCAGNCDPFPAEGDACSEQYARCYAGCENACTPDCKIYGCEGGTWRDLHVPVLPCLDCATYCESMLEPGCASGPSGQTSCVTYCEKALMTGGCGHDYADAMACAGMSPSFTCDRSERPTVAGCESIFDSFYLCVGL